MKTATELPSNRCDIPDCAHVAIHVCDECNRGLCSPHSWEVQITARNPPRDLFPPLHANETNMVLHRYLCMACLGRIGGTGVHYLEEDRHAKE